MEAKQENLLKPWLFPPAVNSRASILLLVLWSLCLLTVFAVVLGFVTRQKLTLADRLNKKDKLYFIAEAGIKKAISRVREESEKSYDALSDDWSNDAGAFKDIGVGDGNFSIFHDYIDERTGLREFGYGLIDEESKIDINKADRPVLERFLRVVLDCDGTQAQELSAAVVDWRDGDSELSIPLGSAEDVYYRNIEYPYEAKDADFEALEEVLLVRGMNEDIFEKIKKYITIYTEGKVNINTASGVVLLALGIRQDLVDKIMSFRAGEDGIAGTGDDNIFEKPSAIVPKLSQSFHLSDSEIAGFSAVAEKYLVTSSRNFMVRCVSKLNDKKTGGEAIAVINRSGKVLSWNGF